MMKEKKLSLKPTNKKIAIVYRIHTADAVKMAKKISEMLKARKYDMYTAPEQKTIAGTKTVVSSNEPVDESTCSDVIPAVSRRGPRLAPAAHRASRRAPGRHTGHSSGTPARAVDDQLRPTGHTPRRPQPRPARPSAQRASTVSVPR